MPIFIVSYAACLLTNGAGLQQQPTIYQNCLLAAGSSNGSEDHQTVCRGVAIREEDILHKSFRAYCQRLQPVWDPHLSAGTAALSDEEERPEAQACNAGPGSGAAVAG